MTSAMEEYLEALQIRSEQEQAQKHIIDDYTKLADAYAAAQKTILATPPPEEKEAQPAPASRIPPSITGSRAPTIQRTSSDATVSLRADLAAANKTVHELTTQIASVRDELETAKSKAAAKDAELSKLSSRAAKLEADKAGLARRLRDKDGELKEKAKFVTDVQDEMVGMETEVNVANDRAKKLEAENKELVERFMKRVGSEADQMNKGSGWN